jgi:hypothetical protein
MRECQIISFALYSVKTPINFLSFKMDVLSDLILYVFISKIQLDSTLGLKLGAKTSF